MESVYLQQTPTCIGVRETRRITGEYIVAERSTSPPKKVEGVVLSDGASPASSFQSARSMAPAMAVGHASGCAAAMAATSGAPPRRLDVKALQKLLKSQSAELRI